MTVKAMRERDTRVLSRSHPPVCSFDHMWLSRSGPCGSSPPSQPCRQGSKLVHCSLTRCVTLSTGWPESRALLYVITFCFGVLAGLIIAVLIGAAALDRAATGE